MLETNFSRLYILKKPVSAKLLNSLTDFEFLVSGNTIAFYFRKFPIDSLQETETERGRFQRHFKREKPETDVKLKVKIILTMASKKSSPKISRNFSICSFFSSS